MATQISSCIYFVIILAIPGLIGLGITLGLHRLRVQFAAWIGFLLPLLIIFGLSVYIGWTGCTAFEDFPCRDGDGSGFELWPLFIVVFFVPCVFLSAVSQIILLTMNERKHKQFASRVSGPLD